jgi:type-F conjugative transfer system pilin assembly protein TrbC
MKRIIFYSIALCSLLYSDATEKDVFVEKYISDKETYQRNQNEADEYRKNLSKDVSIKEISKKERKDIDTTLETNKNNTEASKIAENINNDIKSNGFQKKVEANKDYIFKDKDLNFDEKMGNYKKEIAPEKKLNYKNKFLNSDERLIIAISSSIPDEVIKNYFKSLGDNYEDVLFVMNGFIGNDPKKIMPTLEYISKLLNKDSSSKDLKDKNKYLFRVDINPKLFAKYNINEVPAVIFIKNYNPFLEIQGNGNEENSNSDEQVFISYGDSSLRYSLEQINKKAKSDGLNKMIKNFSKGFLNE